MNDDAPENSFLTLIGYRATGKTTLAQLIARRLGWEWADADMGIECLLGKPIDRIFAEDSEAAFRAAEARVIALLCHHDWLVLAVGGGAPVRLETSQLLRQRGKVIWLTARPETILARMAADPTTASRRPSLTEKPPLEEIQQVLAVREPIYRASADVIVATDEGQPEELASEVLEKLALQGFVGWAARP